MRDETPFQDRVAGSLPHVAAHNFVVTGILPVRNLNPRL
jgi:hypothetical protein